MRDPKRIRKFCNELADIWEAKCPDWRFGQLLVNVLDRDPWFLEEDDMMRVLRGYFHMEEAKRGKEEKMFHKEKFLENQELKNTAYAVGYAIGYFEAACLRAMQSLKVATDQRPLEDLDNDLKLTKEEIEIARELYAGIMAISRGEKLRSNYCRKILDFGYSKSFIKPEGLDKWAEEDAFDAVNYILTNFKEWMKRQCKE